MACGAKDGAPHIDHIKPRSKYPELELDEDNLQVLCKDCNYGKGAEFEDDFRPKPQDPAIIKRDRRFRSLPPEEQSQRVGRRFAKYIAKCAGQVLDGLKQAEIKKDQIEHQRLTLEYLNIQRKMRTVPVYWDES
jgi:hypothetical protein